MIFVFVSKIKGVYVNSVILLKYLNAIGFSCHMDLEYELLIKFYVEYFAGHVTKKGVKVKVDLKTMTLSEIIASEIILEKKFLS